MTIHVNGIDLYYERAGSGPPLILLHGNGESSRIFRKAVGQFAQSYTVYAIDSRGHGRSSRVKELHYADMACDVAGFIAALALDRPMLYGFSDGGIVGLLVAIEWPALLSKLAVSGANITPDGVKAYMLHTVQALYFVTRGARWKLMRDEPQITEGQLERIETPTLVLAGEKDIIREEHTRAIAVAVPGAKLQILPGESHGSYVDGSAKLCEVLAPFLGEGA